MKVMADKYPKELYVRDPMNGGLSNEDTEDEAFIAFEYLDQATEIGCSGEVAIYKLEKIVTVKNETKIVGEN